MSATALVLVGLASALLGLFAGLFVGGRASRERRREADPRYEALRRDFEIVSAVNVRLIERATAGPATLDAAPADDRFFELYDEAKRCLHRTLDRHNATAPRPLVISRDGRNLLLVLSELPARSFSQDSGEDAGVRAWLRRVFELDMERRARRSGSRPDALLARSNSNANANANSGAHP